jgi:hypothetical protein
MLQPQLLLSTRVEANNTVTTAATCLASAMRLTSWSAADPTAALAPSSGLQNFLENLHHACYQGLTIVVGPAVAAVMLVVTLLQYVTVMVHAQPTVCQSRHCTHSCQHAAWKPSNLSDNYQQQLAKVYTWPTKDAATLEAGFAVMTAVTVTAVCPTATTCSAVQHCIEV